MQIKQLKGISLLELMLALAIIAVLLVMATRYFQITRTSEQINDATGMIQSVRSASIRWLEAHENFADISIKNLIDSNLLPTNFGTNPWGGEVTVEGAEEDAKIKITFKGIPIPACKNLVAKFSSPTNPPAPGSCMPGPGDLTDYVGVF